MTQPAAVPIKDEDNSDDSRDAVLFGRGCCSFFYFPCFRPRESDDWERISTTGGEQESVKRNWWDKGTNGVKKVREWSELVAGPKWKTFIRRFNKNGGRARLGKFQYDPLSYSLNFDEGRGQSGELESDLAFRDFSSRYSAVPVQNVQTKDTTPSM